MKAKLLSIILSFLMILSLNTYSQNSDTLCTPNPSKEAVALFRYIHDMYGKKILSGQMWVPWGNDGLVYIKNATGKQPAIMGIDLINESDNSTGVQKAINWWKNSKGILTVMWHWGPRVWVKDMITAKQRLILQDVFRQAHLNILLSGLNLKRRLTGFKNSGMHMCLYCGGLTMNLMAAGSGGASKARDYLNNYGILCSTTSYMTGA